MSDNWVFGYGSLMWRPDFPYLDAVPATLEGAHRALCVYSVVHRGSRVRPGLTMGLDIGGGCRGLAFRIAPEQAPAIRYQLKKREQVTLDYREAMRWVKLANGGSDVHALCFVIDRRHPQYAGDVPLARQAWMVRRAVGVSGRNVDYVMNTFRHLEEMGIEEPRIERLINLLDPLHDTVERAAPIGFRRHGRKIGTLVPVPRPKR